MLLRIDHSRIFLEECDIIWAREVVVWCEQKLKDFSRRNVKNIHAGSMQTVEYGSSGFWSDRIFYQPG